MTDTSGAMTPDQVYQQVVGDAGNDPDETAGLPAATPEAPAEGTEGAPKPGGHNPNWDGAWENVPDPIKEQQRPFFERWDRDYQELQARFTPFKEYSDQGVSEQQIQYALQLQDAITQNPRGFWDSMAEHWGFSSGAQAQAAAEKGAGAAPGDFDIESLDPAQAALARQVEEINAWRQQQEAQSQTFAQQQAQQAAEQQGRVAVERQMAGLEQKYGQIPEDRKVEIVQRAILNGQLNKNASLEVAKIELERQEADIIAKYQRTAPRVLGGNGAGAAGSGQQPPAFDAAHESDEDRRARALAMAANFVAQHQS